MQSLGNPGRYNSTHTVHAKGGSYFMNAQKFTQKSLEAIQSAQSLYNEYGNAEMGQEHLLLAFFVLLPDVQNRCFLRFRLRG